MLKLKQIQLMKMESAKGYKMRADIEPYVLNG